MITTTTMATQSHILLLGFGADGRGDGPVGGVGPGAGAGPPGIGSFGPGAGGVCVGGCAVV